MAAEPGQRSSRKATQKPANRPTVADPEVVAAVGRATARTAHAIVTVAVGLARISAASAKWAAPRLRSLAMIVGRGLWRALAWIGRWTWAHKRGVAAFGHRLLWWGALAILVIVGRALLSADGDPELVGAALMWFCAGLSMSVLVLLGTPQTRMRVAAVALAGGHGSLAALAWVAAVGV